MDDLFANVKTDQVDIPDVFSLTAFVESGNVIADSSALVSRVHKLMSKENGVDLDAPSLEIELPEDEEEDPHGDLDRSIDHCVVSMSAQSVLGYDGAEERSNSGTDQEQGRDANG